MFFTDITAILKKGTATQMHQALYRKYRPATFNDVYGQEHITDVLRYEVEHDSVSHAYLFCGSRGTGKTTCAKILARAINCEAPRGGSPCGQCAACREIAAGTATDVIEMDAASNNGVDAIRQICDEASYTPAMLKRKVYIIDEVHMLSQGAFNALLKTIEEPPEHVVFILATTELQKLPATVISRCQRFDFHRIDVKIIASRLAYIAGQENMTLSEDAAVLLARQAQGGMRDAIGLMELCGAGGSNITGDQVRELLGLSGYDAAAKALTYVAEGNIGALFGIVADVVSSAKDISVYWQELLSFVRDMLICKYAPDPAAYLDLTAQELEILTGTSNKFTMPRLIHICSLLDDAAAKMARTPAAKRMTAELALLKMCRPQLDASAEALAARVSVLEDKLALINMGAPVSGNASQPIEKQPVTQEEAPAAEPPKKEETITADNITTEKVQDISEAISRLDGAHKGLTGFLAQAEIRTSTDGRMLYIFADSFAASLLGQADAKEAIADAFALAKITDGKAGVIVEAKVADTSGSTPADEIGKLL